MDANDTISDTFDMVPYEPVSANVTVIEHDKDLDQDTTFARSNLLELLKDSQDALEDLKVIANQSQNPRAYEVLTRHIKMMVETNKDILEVHKMNAEVKEKEGRIEVHNNNLIVGSVKDFLEQLEKSEKKKDK